MGELLMITTIGIFLGLIVVIQFPLLDILGSVSGSSFFIGIAGAMMIMYALTVLCSLYPGFMATRIHPAQALHYE